MLVLSLMLFACLLGNNNTPEKSASQNSNGDLILREGPSVEEGKKGDKLDKKVCNQVNEIFETATAASDVTLGQATIEERIVSDPGSEDESSRLVCSAGALLSSSPAWSSWWWRSSWPESAVKFSALTGE